MANGQTIILRGQSQRDFAKILIDRAPVDAVVNVRAATRTTEQNAKMWAILSDVSRAKPMGRVLKPEGWKAMFLDTIGKRPAWEPNLDGSGVVCIGYKSSHLTKEEMSDLIEAIYAFGSEHGVAWSEPQHERSASNSARAGRGTCAPLRAPRP